MGSIWVREFSGGLDKRRLPETSPGGTLMRAIDCHVNRGKEIEQRADFVEYGTLPQGQTHGMARTAAGKLVFGHVSSVSNLPDGFTYQQLEHPSGEALTRIQHASLFKGKANVIAEFADGSRYLFYDGALVTDALAPPNASGSDYPTAVMTHAEKSLVLAGPLLYGSAVGDAEDYGSAAGAGDVVHDLSTHTEGAEDLVGMAKYQQYVAVFAESVVQAWFIDPDPDLDTTASTIVNTGALATRAITGFGNEDVFYLSRSGLRSLRVRDITDAANTTDIGSPIDDILIDEVIEAMSADQVSRAIGLVEPRHGRFWLIVQDRIFVFTRFDEAKVSAWTEYRPGFVIDDAIVEGATVWLRSGDTIYTYGGTDAKLQFSSDTQAEVWLPYLDGDAPAVEKTAAGIDASARGTWEVRLAMDPLDENASDKIATFVDSTFAAGRFDSLGDFFHASLRFKAKAPQSATEPARLSSAILHFTSSEEEDA